MSQKHVSISANLSPQAEVLEAIDASQSQDTTPNLDDAYNALKRLEGIGGQGHPNASQLIDELLYGKDGAWRDE